MRQRDCILDTNVYGELLTERNSVEIIERIRKDKSINIYGLDIIEKELKETPVEVKYQNRLLKEAVLSIYKEIINDQISLFPLARYLASEYYIEFDRLRNSGKYHKLLSQKIKKYKEADLKVDFQIIAIASLKGIDIVVSTDQRTILSQIAEETYNKINSINKLRTPKLVRYSDFIRWYKHD